MLKPVILALSVFSWVCYADDTPCEPVGISHCDDFKFVCNDGSVEKRQNMNCTERVYGNTQSDVEGDLNGDGVLSGNEQYLYNSRNATSVVDHDYEGGRYQSSSSNVIHTGPRGGQYTINSNGNKSYIPRNK